MAWTVHDPNQSDDQVLEVSSSVDGATFGPMIQLTQLSLTNANPNPVFVPVKSMTGPALVTINNFLYIGYAGPNLAVTIAGLAPDPENPDSGNVLFQQPTPVPGAHSAFRPALAGDVGATNVFVAWVDSTNGAQQGAIGVDIANSSLSSFEQEAACCAAIAAPGLAIFNHQPIFSYVDTSNQLWLLGVPGIPPGLNVSRFGGNPGGGDLFVINGQLFVSWIGEATASSPNEIVLESFQ